MLTLVPNQGSKIFESQRMHAKTYMACFVVYVAVAAAAVCLRCPLKASTAPRLEVTE